MDELYTRELLSLATGLIDQPLLGSADGEAERRSPVCGSRVRANVRLDEDGRIVAHGQDVRACAVGQASAAIVGESIVGRSSAEVHASRDELQAYLNGEGETLDSWPDLRLLAAVRGRKARYAAALLPFDAVIGALEDARSRSRNATTSAS